MAVAQTPADLRVPPQNLDAERGLLGSILLVSETLDEVADRLRATHFYSDAHQRIYAVIQALYDRGAKVDVVTVAEELAAKDELETIGGPPYLTEILEAVPHAAHARYYASIVRDKWIQRSLIYGCTEVLQKAYDPTSDTDELLQYAEQTVFRILEQQEHTTQLGIGDILIDAFDRINDRLQTEGTISGITTGFTDLDSITSGFQSTELVILASRPSMGKTALVCNIAETVARESGSAVLIFSLEQSRLELAERFLCINAGINGHDLRAGDLDESQRHALMESSSELSELPLFVDDQPGRGMSQMAAVARRLHRKDRLGLIVVDYLQLIESDDRISSREQQISQISRRLKFLAKELSVPVVALSQLNRGVELREEKRPRLADLRESGAIEQDADLVMFLHRPDAYNPEDRPGEADVIVAKHRSGPTGIVRLTWRKEFMRFENYSYLQEPENGYFANSNSSGSF